LGTVLKHSAFNELRRLGLPAEAEDEVRAASPCETGLLVVEEVLPGQASDGKLKVGDIILKVNGGLISRFAPLEATLDNRVGTSLEVSVSRAGAVKRLSIGVDDLEFLSPSRFLQVGSSIVNPLSYHQARNHGLPVGAPYVASAGYMFHLGGIRPGAIIKAIGDTRVENIQDLEDCLEALPADQIEITVRYHDINSPGGLEQIKALGLAMTLTLIITLTLT